MSVEDSTLTAPAQATAVIEEVTPEMALDLLANNTRNRKLRPGHVERLSGAMVRGEWELNGEAIKISIDGDLLDGQHRLHAVVEADVAIKSVVIYGLPPETQDTMDTGSKRSMRDVLEIRGEKYHAVMGSALAMLWRYKQRKTMRTVNPHPTQQQLIQLLDEHGDMRDSILPAWRVYETTRLKTSVGVPLHYMFSMVDKEAADEFFAKLHTGLDLHDTEDPIFVLRRQLQADLLRPRKAHVETQAAWTVRAWNLWRAGKRTKLLRWVKTGPGKMPFPEIDGLDFGGELLEQGETDIGKIAPTEE